MKVFFSELHADSIKNLMLLIASRVEGAYEMQPDLASIGGDPDSI